MDVGEARRLEYLARSQVDIAAPRARDDGFDGSSVGRDDRLEESFMLRREVADRDRPFHRSLVVPDMGFDDDALQRLADQAWVEDFVAPISNDSNWPGFRGSPLEPVWGCSERSPCWL